MTTDNDEFRNSVIAAVQAELDRHASVVGAGIEQAREEARIERARLRADHAEQLSRLARSVEQVESRAGRRGDRSGKAVDAKLAEFEQRQSARLTELADGFDRTISGSVTPLIEAVRAEFAGLAARVEALEVGLRQLDEQAARLVDHVSDVVTRIDQRNLEVTTALSTELGTAVDAKLAALRSDLDPRVTGIERRLTEVHDRIDDVVSSRLVVVDERLAGVDGRLAEAEQRLAAGQQRLEVEQQGLVAGQQRLEVEQQGLVAEQQRLEVEQQGLVAEQQRLAGDVEQRLARTADRFDDVDRRLRETATAVASIDLKALDTMQEKLSTAAGEAMLVRIEMERFQKVTNERSDQIAIRLTEVETALQDSSMDVSTAVQLDRLEEIERALAELDPDQFVRKDGRDAPLSATAPDAEPDLLEQPGAETLSLDAAQLITTLDAPGRPVPTATNGDGQNAIIAVTRPEQDD